MKKSKYIVLGLGIFGSTITKTLSQFGCHVITVDKNEECIQRLCQYTDKAVIGDITDKQLLLDIGANHCDKAVVATGTHLENSLIAVLLLKELGIPFVIAKATSMASKRELELVGADLVVLPEKEMGERVARSLVRKNITDLIEIDENNSVAEMKVPALWVGNTLSELNLRQQYGINIIGIKKANKHHLELSVEPKYRLQKGDQFLMIADPKIIEIIDVIVNTKSLNET